MYFFLREFVKTELSKIIESSYSKADAIAACSFRPNKLDVQQLQDVGSKVLTIFPYTPGACALMSAMWAAFIRKTTEYPIHVVAGSLFVDGNHIFGNDSTANQLKKELSRTNSDWDGHCWIIFGNQIADISIFRTAYSETSSPILKKKILSEFGEGKGFLIAPTETLREKGIVYDSKYVLTDEEISGLSNGGRSMC